MIFTVLASLFLPCGAHPSRAAEMIEMSASTSDDDLDQALSFERNFEWQRARDSAMAAYRKDTSNLSALRVYIRNCFLTGQASEALSLAKQLAIKEPAPINYAYFAQCAAYAGKFREAKPAVEELLRFEELWRPSRSEFLGRIDPACARRYEMVFRIDPAKVQNQEQIAPDVRVPIPPTRLPYQKAESRVEGAEAYRTEMLEHGAECLRVTPRGNAPFKVVSQVTLIPHSFDAAGKSAKFEGYPDSVTPYLKATKACNFDNQQVAVLAKELKRATPYETIRAVLKWCPGNLHFVPPGKDGGGSASQVIERSYGHCEALSTVAIALLRSCGIPARFVRGHGAIVGDSGHGSHHTITEFYVNGCGWIPWDFEREPFGVCANFVALWSYDAPGANDTAGTSLMHIQRLGLACEYVDFDIRKRWLP